MKKTPLLILAIVLIVAFIWRANRATSESPHMHITGVTMGTITYNVKYAGNTNFKEAIDKVLNELNQSLSTYIPNSEISQLNDEGELTFKPDYFLPILETSAKVFKQTDGTFDPSIGPLVQAWGFGPDKRIPQLDSSAVDSLLSMIGFDRITFDDNSVTMPDNYQLDFSAIAKGYAVDLVAKYLEENNIEHYMVEIGGEVRCKGANEKGKTWTLGIEDPTVENTDRKIFARARLKDRSLATSGNYRNYYEKDGRIYAHIIDPRTGYNATHNLLSVSVFAEDCMTADAYATAFMVLGMEQSMTIVQRENSLDAVFIYQDNSGELASLVTDGMKSFVETY